MALSSLTPFSDELQRAFRQVNSQPSSGNSSARVSPRGRGSIIEGGVGGGGGSSVNRARSTEATREGMIDGVAVTDGAAILGATGVVFDNGPDFPQLKLTPVVRLSGGFLGASSTTTQRTQDTAAAVGSYAAPSFLPGNSSSMLMSGMNATPREGGGGGFTFLGRPQQPVGGSSGFGATYTGLKSKSIPVGAAAAAYGGAAGTAGLNTATNTATDDFTASGDEDTYNSAEYDDGEDDEEELDEDQQEADVLPKRFRPQVTTTNPMLGPAGASRGLTEEDMQEQRLRQKAEFQSFDVVASLLAVSGAERRRDLLEYHTPIAFLQFLEQLMCGAYFIRFYKKNGTPHERYLYLRMIEVEPGVERPFLCQCKHATAVQIDDCVPVADLIGVEAGATSPAFTRQMDKDKPGFVKGSYVKSKRPFFSTQGALSLYFYDRKHQSMRSLDILTTNMTVFRLWKLSLDALVAVNTVKTGPHPQTVAQNMRALFLAVRKTWMREAAGREQQAFS